MWQRRWRGWGWLWGRAVGPRDPLRICDDWGWARDSARRPGRDGAQRKAALGARRGNGPLPAGPHKRLRRGPRGGELGNGKGGGHESRRSARGGGTYTP